MARTYTEDELRSEIERAESRWWNGLTKQAEEQARLIASLRGRPGRKPGLKTAAFPTSAEQHQMRAKASELRQQIKDLKKFWNENRKRPELQRGNVEHIAASIRTKPADKIAAMLGQNKRPSEILIWLVAKHFGKSQPHTKKILSKLR